jgi:transcription initiation factor TFIIIB Brf1 subunit/transcription initiation factor TFIIB
MKKMFPKVKARRKIWKCDCGNEDQAKIITALDGEVVCGECGTVLGQVMIDLDKRQDQTDSWDAEADLCRKMLEDRVSKKGWNF